MLIVNLLTNIRVNKRFPANSLSPVDVRGEITGKDFAFITKQRLAQEEDDSLHSLE